jgi:chromosome segregation ATPase
MKLTRLRLLGFKSFVEPTDFLIEPGLTGVVGPNGCGKSNLVEALRWVMGESSHKSMRAASMDDVIFSGNTTRPARNNAEVAISIDNSERSAPAAFNDTDMLEIARRIERESGSNYRINGRDVRARDVQILFADASTGARSPALVHQGRIGEIIQAKPEQRRRVLEEAAGVAGLHARRHEAELRLKAAENNLLRAEDVIGQLTAQMDALKKQARQAVRYRTVSAQVRKAEATLYHLRWTAASAEVGAAEQANLAPAGERTQQVNHLDPGLELLDRHRLLLQRRGRAMNGRSWRVGEFSQTVNGLPQDVKEPSQGLGTHGYRDRGACVLGCHAAERRKVEQGILVAEFGDIFQQSLTPPEGDLCPDTAQLIQIIGFQIREPVKIAGL